MSTEKSINILLKLFIKKNHEVNWMVTEADFEQRILNQEASPSQYLLLMATDREILHEVPPK